MSEAVSNEEAVMLIAKLRAYLQDEFIEDG